MEMSVPEKRLTKSLLHLSSKDKVEILQAEVAGVSWRGIDRMFRRDDKTISRFCKRSAETKSLRRKLSLNWESRLL